MSHAYIYQGQRSNLMRSNTSLALAAAETDSSGQTYTVNFINNSNNAGSAYMFQSNPGANLQGVLALAWFSYGTNPGTVASFQWEVDYNMFWSTTGVLAGGVNVVASQSKSCTLQSNNEIGLTYNSFGFTFQNQTTSSTPGISFLQDNTIPANTASIGIGMSGAGTFAVQAQPNMTANFNPTPTYWLGFSLAPIQQGSVLINQNPTGVPQITFPPSMYTATVTLSSTNVFSVSYSV
ncbi:MAG: hypothetical protein ACXV8O_03030 [Methylobacter sp.]